MRTNLIEITIPSLMLYVAVEIPTFQPSAFAWKWIMIINNKLSISRFTPTLFKKMWKSHRSLWLLWFTMPCDPSYACFTLVYVKRNLTEYQTTDDRLILLLPPLLLWPWYMYALMWFEHTGTVSSKWISVVIRAAQQFTFWKFSFFGEKSHHSETTL